MIKTERCSSGSSSSAAFSSSQKILRRYSVSDCFRMASAFPASQNHYPRSPPFCKMSSASGSLKFAVAVGYFITGHFIQPSSCLFNGSALPANWYSTSCKYLLHLLHLDTRLRDKAKQPLANGPLMVLVILLFLSQTWVMLSSLFLSCIYRDEPQRWIF